MTTLAEEHEDRAATRPTADALGDHSAQAVDSPAQVDWLGAEIDVDADGDHVESLDTALASAALTRSASALARSFRAS
ncbi:MAG: hypothetical protein ACK6CU_27365, partial [Deltaproteobacteria bacterium]